MLPLEWENYKWQVVIGFKLGSPLISLFYPSIVACYLKFVVKLIWKYCGFRISFYFILIYKELRSRQLWKYCSKNKVLQHFHYIFIFQPEKYMTRTRIFWPVAKTGWSVTWPVFCESTQLDPWLESFFKTFFWVKKIKLRQY